MKDGLIIYAEDNKQLRETMVEVLRRCGIIVTPVADGKQALSLFRIQKAHCVLVITSVILYYCPGLALARTVKEEVPGLPVIVFTGMDLTPCDVEGIDVYVKKSEGIDALIAAVKHLLAAEHRLKSSNGKAVYDNK